MSVTNEQRNEIKALIRRRIEAAAEAFKKEHRAEIDAFAEQAKSSARLKAIEEKLAKMQKLAEAMNQTKVQYEALWAELRGVGVGNESTPSYSNSYNNLDLSDPSDWFHNGAELFPRVVAKVIESEVEDAANADFEASEIGGRLRDLAAVEEQLSDATILATTDAQLRKLVDEVGTALGLVENSWLKKIVPAL